jgi:hypothetical protein
MNDCKRIQPVDRFAKTTTCKRCGREVFSAWSPSRGFYFGHVLSTTKAATR